MIRRKNYLIDRGFQLDFAVKFILLFLLEAALIAVLFIRISGDTITTGYADSVLMVESTPSFFLVPFLLIILITAVGIGLAGMVVFVLLSHRIAGPLYRFEKDIEDVGYGDLTKRISTRKADQLTEIKESLNCLIATFDERISRIKAILSEIKDLKDGGSGSDAERIKDAARRLEEELSRFRVTQEPKR
jgi:methyl-accepting chemotaxis protein